MVQDSLRGVLRLFILLRLIRYVHQRNSSNPPTQLALFLVLKCARDVNDFINRYNCHFVLLVVGITSTKTYIT